jgi:ssDNA-binding Zn-finger/Zn-ribbon topoisomerase 1
MKCLDHLKAAGLVAAVADGRLRVSPKERLTPGLTAYIRANATAIRAEAPIVGLPGDPDGGGENLPAPENSPHNPHGCENSGAAENNASNANPGKQDEGDTTSLEPTGPCPVCGGGGRWQPREGGRWHCRHCYPDMPATATTVALPGGAVPEPSPAAGIDAEALLVDACQGLDITPTEVEFELVDDMDDLRGGVLTPTGLRQTAEALDLPRSPAPAPKPKQGAVCCDCRHYLRVDGQKIPPRALWCGPTGAWRRRTMVGWR